MAHKLPPWQQHHSQVDITISTVDECNMLALLLISITVSELSLPNNCFDQVMREQEVGGKIFFLDGTGAWGNPTPQNVAYGAAKRAITQVKVRHGAQMVG